MGGGFSHVNLQKKNTTKPVINDLGLYGLIVHKDRLDRKTDDQVLKRVTHVGLRKNL